MTRPDLDALAAAAERYGHSHGIYNIEGLVEYARWLETENADLRATLTKHARRGSAWRECGGCKAPSADLCADCEDAAVAAVAAAPKADE